MVNIIKYHPQPFSAALSCGTMLALLSFFSCEREDVRLGVNGAK